MLRKLALAGAVVLISLPVIAQLPSSSPAKTDSNEELKEQAIGLLKEMRVDIDGLRLVENRISFASELAAMMWPNDEREARALYASVINDFRQLIGQLDNQVNMLPTKTADEPEGYMPMSMGEPSDRMRLMNKLRVANNVRQTLATNMAERDPEMALNFFYESASAISNPDLRKMMTASDNNLEQALMEKLAASDPTKAAQLAKKSLEKGFNAQQVDLLKKLYAKDIDKAVELGDSYLSRIRGERSETLDLNAVSTLLKYGTQLLDQSRTMSGQRGIFTDAQLRDLAEALAQAVLARPQDAPIPIANYARDVERFQPGRAVQIRNRAQARTSVTTRPGGAPPPIARPANAGEMSYSATGSGNSAQMAARMQREQQEKRTLDDVMKLTSAKLPNDQREKVITQARRSILAMPGKDKKVTGLSLLAAQVYKLGDKDLAAEIMRDAASFVNPQPRNYQEFILSWLLAAGYSSMDSDRSFSILEDTVNRCNDVIEAAVKVAEFMDTNDEIIIDGELQIGGFGGGASMLKSLTNTLAGFDPTIQALAKSDFQKTRDLTNRFNRPEARVFAKMLVLRAVLGKQQPKPAAKPA